MQGIGIVSFDPKIPTAPHKLAALKRLAVSIAALHFLDDTGCPQIHNRHTDNVRLTEPIPFG